jgi:hypothetical protein
MWITLLRRTTLHLVHIFFTDARTFMFVTPVFSAAGISTNCRSEAVAFRLEIQDRRRALCNLQLFIAVYNPSACQIIGGQFDQYFVARQYSYEVLAHLAGNVSQNHVLILEFDPKHGVGQRFDHCSNNLYGIFLRHSMCASDACN